MRGRLVPGLPPSKAASIEPVPGRVEVPGLAKPVNGRPVFVIGLTAGLAPCILVTSITESIDEGAAQQEFAREMLLTYFVAGKWPAKGGARPSTLRHGIFVE